MGREKGTIKTYGRHRQRIITADIWSSDEEKKSRGQVFSNSSSSEYSLNSTKETSSLIFNTRNRKRKNTKGLDKENVGRVCTKRFIEKATRGSERDSCSSTGSDVLFKSQRPRRALKDRNYKEDDTEKKTKSRISGKRKRIPTKKYSPAGHKYDSVGSANNFSEFDDYSFVISGSPPQHNVTSDVFSPHFLRSSSKTKIDTSTPCAKRQCSSNVLSNLSVINYVDDEIAEISIPPSLEANHSPYNGDHVSKGYPRLELSKKNESSHMSNSKSVCRTEDESSFKSSPVNPCIIQLEKLRKSFLSMHVSKRSSKHSSSKTNQSESLFSSLEVTDECVTAESELDDSDENEDNDESNDEEEEDLSDIAEGEEDGDVGDKNSQEETRYLLASPHSDDYYTAESDKSMNDSCSISNISVNKSLHNKSLFDVLTPRKQPKDTQVKSPKSKILEVCHQNQIISFDVCITNSMMKQCKKVGEGVYGEVFRTSRGRNAVALKVIPIEGSFQVNDENQKSFEEILPEIVISTELSLLRENEECYTQNFCEVQRVSCVQGEYPSKLLEEWNVFHEKKVSENDNPDVFGPEQLFIVFEFADGGKDLESAQFTSFVEAKSVFDQVTYSLAVAEEALQFEHRDLHWGNILVKKTAMKTMEYVVLGQSYKVECHGVHVSIIDFTLSRLDKDGCTVYIDLSTDDTLFEGTGDYQFDIYRKMKEINGNEWKTFTPKTNVLWLHYLADKLIRSKRYKTNTRTDQTMLRKFRTLTKELLNYTSACDIIVSSDFFSS